MSYTVHILHHGWPLCGFSTRVPREWPEDHRWVRIDSDDANCVGCIGVRANIAAERNRAIYTVTSSLDEPERAP
jgi:hypothetical protein